MINTTSYAAQAVPLVDAEGRQVIVAIVKATFNVDAEGRLKLADAQRPIRMADEPHDAENEWSSLRYASDLCPQKVGTDVIVVGEAVSEQPVAVMDVAVRVREATVPLRVHGPRVYYQALAGVGVGPAAKFERVPLVYELAYGGATADYAIVERRNPAGRGVAKKPSDLVGKPAPQIEHPGHPITKASDRPAPVGFGAIATSWSPRSEYAGTHDERWMTERMPLMPADFDVRHYNTAHPSLVFDPPLAPGDTVATLGLVPRGLFRFELPDLRLRLDGWYADDDKQSFEPGIDTVIVEPSAGCVEIVARHAFAMGRGKRALREVRAEVR